MVVEGEGEIVVVFPVSWDFILFANHRGRGNGVGVKKVGKGMNGVFDEIGLSRREILEADENRIYCPAGRLWRRCGGGRGSVCMSRNDNRGVAAMKFDLVLGHNDGLRHVMRR